MTQHEKVSAACTLTLHTHNHPPWPNAWTFGALGKLGCATKPSFLCKEEVARVHPGGLVKKRSWQSWRWFLRNPAPNLSPGHPGETRWPSQPSMDIMGVCHGNCDHVAGRTVGPKGLPSCQTHRDWPGRRRQQSSGEGESPWRRGRKVTRGRLARQTRVVGSRRTSAHWAGGVDLRTLAAHPTEPAACQLLVRCSEALSAIHLFLDHCNHGWLGDVRSSSDWRQHQQTQFNPWNLCACLLVHIRSFSHSVFLLCLLCLSTEPSSIQLLDI